MPQNNNLYETYLLFKKCRKFFDEFKELTKNQFKTIVYTRYDKIYDNICNFISDFFFDNATYFLSENNFNKEKFDKTVSDFIESFVIIDKILIKQRKLNQINESNNIEIENLNNEFDILLLVDKIKIDEKDKINTLFESLESDSEKYSDNFSLDDIMKNGQTFKFSYNTFMKNILNQETIQQLIDYDNELMDTCIGLRTKDNLDAFFCGSFTTCEIYKIDYMNNSNLFSCSCPHFEYICSKHISMECKHIKLLKKIISYLKNYFKNDKWLCYEDITDIFEEIITISH